MQNFVRFKSSKTPSSSAAGNVKINGKRNAKDWWKMNSNYYNNVENFHQFGPVIRAKWMEKQKSSLTKMNNSKLVAGEENILAVEEEKCPKKIQKDKSKKRPKDVLKHKFF